MNKHMIWMVIGCVLPLLLIFLLPVIGINLSNNVAFFVFILLMFACHLFMMKGHDHDHNHHDNSSQTKQEQKGDNSHQHH